MSIGSSFESSPSFISRSSRSPIARSECVRVRFAEVEAFNLIVRQCLYCSKVRLLFSGYDRDRRSCPAGPSGPTNPVEVGVRILGNVVVDDVRNSFDI